MSFSSDVKKELSNEKNKRRHCQIAEFAAIFACCCKIIPKSANRYTLLLQTENFFAAKKFFTLLEKCFNITADVSVKVHPSSKESRLYTVYIGRAQDCMMIMQTLKLADQSGSPKNTDLLVNPLLIQKVCCKRAFLRGAFLTSGSMSNPQKSYHLEIVCDTEAKASQVKEIMQSLSLNARIVSRKKQFVVYLKEGEQIVDLLNAMEAHVSLMDFENTRILRDIANQINRQTNCDVANSQKTVTASAKQREDILLIDRTRGLSSLPENLQEIARLRLENPELPIKELGELLNVPIGKSGVNHRLRRLSQIADEIREN